MTVPKQLINLIGIVVIVALLVAGVTLIAMPMYGSARTIDADTRTVAETNDLYEVRIARLTEANGRIQDISADVSRLRGEIAASSHLDDVMAIVVDAAASAGATIDGVSAADAEPWTPRAGLGDDEAAAPAPADEPAAEGGAEPAAGGGADDGAVADGGAADGTAAVAPAVSPRKQIPVTITVTPPDAAAAAAFVDALGRGPRLLVPIDATLAGGTLTVTALALVRTED